MPLQPQVIDIDMGLGLDTFTDPKRVVPGKFTTLENARFRRGKRLEMRRGAVAFGETYKLGNTGSATNTFNAFSDRLHIKRGLAFGEAPLFFGEYQDAAGSRITGYRWASGYRDMQTAASRLKITPSNSARLEASLCNTVRAEAYYRPSRNVVLSDSCMVGDKIVTIWSEVDTTGLISVFAEVRTSAGELVSRSDELTGGSTSGWVMAVAVSDTRAWLFDASTGTGCAITIVDVTAPVWTARYGYTVTTAGIVDAVVLGSNVFVAGHGFDGGTGIVIKSVATSTATPTAGMWTAKNAYAVAGTVYCVCIAKPQSTDTKLRVFWRQSSGGTYGVSMTASSGSTAVAATLLVAITIAAYQISAVVLEDNAVWVAYSAMQTSTNAHTCWVFAHRENGSWGSAIAGIACDGMLVSRAHRRASTNTASFWVRSFNADATESAYFQYQIQNGGVALSGRLLGGRAHPHSLITTQPLCGVSNVFDETSTVERLVLSDAYAVVVDSASSRTPSHGLAIARANYDPRQIGPGVYVDKCLMLPGGITGWWDGAQMSHHGVMLRPTIASIATASSAGAMSNGTYSVVVVPYWRDSAGNEHLGAPSDPFSVTLSAGGSAQRMTTAGYNSDYLHFVGTYPTTGTGEPQFRFYSTTNGGTIYYRCQTAGNSSVRICSDTDLVTRDVLPTTGGVLPNTAIDGPPAIGSFNDRIVLAAASDDGVLYVSKPSSPGYAPEISDELSIPISPAGGPVTAIVESIDKCVVFKASTIQVFTGEGFTANGAGGGYSPAETIHETIGCPGAWAAVSTKLGIMFDTGGQGIWLLDRGLQLVFVGEPVDAYKDDEVQSSVVVASEDEVRFLLASGVTLCFNLDRNTWSVTTPTPCWDIGYVNGQALWLRKSESGLGGVYRDDDDTFTDAMNGVADTSAAAIQLQGVTGWMSFAGIQGYQRVWRALFTGDYGDVHNLLIDAAYDYQDTYADSFVLSSASIGQPYDGQVWMKRGFSKAVRFKLRASSSAGDTVGPMSLTGLSFEVGLLPRAARMKSSKGA